MDEKRKLFEDIKKFHDRLTKSKYIIRVNNKYYDANDEGFDKYQVTFPKNISDCYKGGVCWDLCIFQSFWFDRYHPEINPEFYYHETVFDEETRPSHTFMIFPFNNDWYWFEASWKSVAGIYHFTSKQECLAYVTNFLIKNDTKTYKKKPKKRILVKYNPLNTKYNGLKVFEFMKEMWKIEQTPIPKFHNVNPITESTQTGFEIVMNPDDRISEIKFIKGKNGLQNSLVKVKGIDGWCRGRSEVLILKDKDIFLGFKKTGDYKVPGGGWEPNEHHAISGIREAQEEARITAGNPMYVLTYLDIFDEPHGWVKKKIPKKFWWYSYFTEVYVAEYLEEYTGYINKLDQDSLVKYGKFYPINTVFQKLKPYHQNAIVAYFRERRPVI